MKCRKNIRKLVQEYNSASAAEKPNTALMKLKKAILDLKNPAIRPSLITDAQADGAASRYDDFVWAHHNVMMEGPNNTQFGGPGPNWAHRGPSFGPWHRGLLKLYEQELQSVSGDPNLTLPFWNWTKDRTAADPGFPFFADFLGPDGAGNPNDKVTVGAFAQANGWNLNVDEENFGFLRRHFGIDGPGLPTPNSVQTTLKITPYDNSPWNQTAASATSFRNTLEGWLAPSQMHNAVHRWVNGSMQPGTSPNDPVFFFHHCNIDRLWAVWQQKNPTAAQYLPDNTTPTANGLTRLNDKMGTFGRTASDRYFGIDTMPSDVLNSKSIIWYESDLPELNNETGGTLSFVNVPEGLTSFKAIKFKIVGCRPVHFRITGAPTGDFGLTTLGTEFTASPDESGNFFYGYVWVQLVAVAGAVPPSSVDIHAYIVDEEGYYAATEGGEYPLGDFHVELTATTVARENNSVALVLDRSGSMADPAGGTSTKSDLLKTAIQVFRDLMLSNDEVAVVTFDNLVDTAIPIQQVSAAPSFSTVDVTPRNTTWIGGGIQQGAVQLAAAAHSNKSMVVLTDGNENVHPYIAEIDPALLTSRTYAIGFGLPGTVSDAALNQITSNSHGDLIITGDISTDEQRFNLTKYFVQVLAGVTNMNVILDPQGSLFLGSRHVIPFLLSNVDVYADVITLCPIPKLLDFALETPDGKIIKPTTPAPNVRYVQGQQVLFYRVVLPALAADPTGSHAGTWKAILSIKGGGISNERAVLAAAQANSVRGSLPYSFVVHAYSNLNLNAYKTQDSLRPGAAVTLFASLTEYDVPLQPVATVWAQITTPDQGTIDLKLNKINAATYSASFNTTLPGVYLSRVRAEGYTSKGRPFTREKTLTAGVYYGNYNPMPDPKPAEEICHLIHCFLSEETLSPIAIKRLAELGINVKHLSECFARTCPEKSVERIPELKYKAFAAARKKQLQAKPAITLKKTAAAKPIKLPAKPMRKMLPKKETISPFATTAELAEFLRQKKAKAKGKRK